MESLTVSNTFTQLFADKTPFPFATFSPVQLTLGRIQFHKYPTDHRTKKLQSEISCFLLESYQIRQNCTFSKPIYTFPLRILLKPWLSLSAETESLGSIVTVKICRRAQKMNFTLQMEILVLNSLVQLETHVLMWCWQGLWSDVEK